jgi:hypothetical protein
MQLLFDQPDIDLIPQDLSVVNFHRSRYDMND